MVGNESCDDGLAPGCLYDCSGPSIGYQCTANICTPICGDGRVISPETCDDGSDSHTPPYSITGCLTDCSDTDPKWVCSGGDFLMKT